MSIHIDHDHMISRASTHHARRVHGHDWEVSWLPEQQLTRNDAITAMTLAEIVATKTAAGGLSCDDPDWSLIDALASELGLTGPAAVTRLGV
ncbi:hypothetical protein [Phytoactinopolyspora mesophila]|uniref:Uncharacterized protein n=1 Tax=Phytoactinopolyspora mesophila TaxID=2650750 RepID=A0A7K3MDC2_9ACTN|nr:hypothetical protein [Phytoactinopolyspora mesophila]NDL60992.1 hypothetical protein [Phytoactinopolyspora mesophila]